MRRGRVFTLYIPMKYGTIALIALVALSLSGGTASAQSGALNGAVDAAVDITTGSGAGADVSADADAAADEGADTPVSQDTQADADFSLRLLQRDINSGNAEGEGSVSVSSAADVTTEDSLRAYAESTLRANESIDAVEMDGEGMVVRYRQPARFLGFIPGHMPVTVNVTNDGAVSVDYPWYAFLMTTDTDRADFESRLASEIGAAFDASGEAMANAMLTVNAEADAEQAADALEGAANTAEDRMNQVRARVLERVQEAFSADAEVSAEAGS